MLFCVAAPASNDRLTIILASCFSVVVIIVLVTIIIFAIGKPHYFLY